MIVYGQFHVPSILDHLNCLVRCLSAKSYDTEALFSDMMVDGSLHLQNNKCGHFIL